MFILSRYNKRNFKVSERDDFQWIHFVRYKTSKTVKTNLPSHGVKPETDDCPEGQWLCSPEIRKFYDCMCVVLLILHASVFSCTFFIKHHLKKSVFVILMYNIFEIFPYTLRRLLERSINFNCLMSIVSTLLPIISSILSNTYLVAKIQ